MLKLGTPSASALAPRLIARPAWRDADAAAADSTRVWPLRPAFPAIAQAALALGPVALRAGDGLCRTVQHGLLHAPTPPASDGQAGSGATLHIDGAPWARCVATQLRHDDGRVHRAVAFFDAQGHAALQIDLLAGASPEGFQDLVRRFGPRVADGDGRTGGGHRQHVPAADAGLHLLQRQGAPAGLAEPLACDAVLEVLRHACQARLAMTAHFACQGLRIAWTGALLALSGRPGRAVARAFDMELAWSETRPGLQAWLLREPAPCGLVQSLALLGPDGALRLLLRPAGDGARPQPCAWRAAIGAARGEPCGSAC